MQIESNELIEHLCKAGASLVGFADISVVNSKLRHDLPRAVSIAVALTSSIVEEIVTGPTVDYAGEYERVNVLLDEIAESCSKYLRERGYEAEFAPATVIDLDLETLSTPLPHKTAATRAGLGWIGKCALLVTEEFGSAVRLITVLTDAPLPVGEPIEQSRCGECTLCTNICPSQAPSGNEWSIGTKRADFYDAFACCRTAITHSRSLGIKHTICGMCIAVCPWTQRYLSQG